MGEKAAQPPVPSCLWRRAPKEVLCTWTQSSSCAPAAPQLLPGQGLCGGESPFVTSIGPIPRRLASGTVSSPPFANWSLLGFSHEETQQELRRQEETGGGVTDTHTRSLLPRSHQAPVHCSPCPFRPGVVTASFLATLWMPRLPTFLPSILPTTPLLGEARLLSALAWITGANPFPARLPPHAHFLFLSAPQRATMSRGAGVGRRTEGGLQGQAGAAPSLAVPCSSHGSLGQSLKFPKFSLLICKLGKMGAAASLGVKIK